MLRKALTSPAGLAAGVAALGEAPVSTESSASKMKRPPAEEIQPAGAERERRSIGVGTVDDGFPTHLSPPTNPPQRDLDCQVQTGWRRNHRDARKAFREAC